MSPTYLQQLTLRLAIGMAGLPADIRGRHAAYLKAAQRPDGGFAGRAGDSDPYYTSFALRGLSLLGELRGAVAERAAAFVHRHWSARTSIVDVVSLIYSGALLEMSVGIPSVGSPTRPVPEPWAGAATQPAEISARLESLRRPDGGYAKSPDGAAGSTYQTFLTLTCQQLMGQAPVEPQRTAGFILSHRCTEGGFRDIRAAKRPGTNPTAAAIGALQILEALDGDTRRDTIRFLAAMQTEEGGLRANTQIPIADLLSTFTGVLTLGDLDALAHIDPAAVEHYAAVLQHPQGGFRGAAWDDTADVEYTFYGLGCLALTSGKAGRR